MTTNDHPANELARVLLTSADGKIQTAGRNLLSSQFIVSKARHVHDEIGKLITTINTSPKLEWPVFVKYTKAVDPLERLLLDLLEVTFAPSDQHVPPDDSTANSVTFITSWEKDKSVVIKALGGLSAKPLEALLSTSELSLERSTIKSRNADDFATLKEICSKMDTLRIVPEKLVNKGKTLVADLKTKAKSIKDAFSNEEKAYDPKLAILAVKSVMAAYTLHAVLVNKGTNKEWQKHLLTAALWEEANNLLDDVKLRLASGDVTNLSELKTSYNAFEAHLLRLGGDLAVSLLDIARKAGLVRRPFYGRSVALVTMCHVLQDHSNSPEQDGPIDLRLLTEVFAKALAALTKASNTATDVKTFITTDPEFLNIVNEFAAATSKAKECFEEYKLEWSEHEIMFNAAVSTDHLHFKDLQRRLQLAGHDVEHTIGDIELAGKAAS